MDHSNLKWILADLEKLREQAVNLNIKANATETAANTLIDDIENVKSVIEATLRDEAKVIEESKMDQEFRIASLTRKDIGEVVMIPDLAKLPDWTMKTIAGLVGDDFMNKHFWKIVKERATYVLNDIPNEDDGEAD